MAVKSGALVRVVVMLVLFAFLIFALVFEIKARNTKTTLHDALQKKELTRKEVGMIAGQEPVTSEKWVNDTYVVDTYHFRSGIPGRKFIYTVVYGNNTDTDPDEWVALEGRDEKPSPNYLREPPKARDTPTGERNDKSDLGPFDQNLDGPDPESLDPEATDPKATAPKATDK